MPGWHGGSVTTIVIVLNAGFDPHNSTLHNDANKTQTREDCEVGVIDNHLFYVLVTEGDLNLEENSPKYIEEIWKPYFPARSKLSFRRCYRKKRSEFITENAVGGARRNLGENFSLLVFLFFIFFL